MPTLPVLVVEDDFLIRTCLVEFLQDNGLEVRETENCAEATAEIRSATALGALVADLTLPDGDGMALAHEARRKWPNLPMIYISGYGAMRRDEAIGEPELNRFIAKPYSLVSILEAIREMTNLPRG